MVYDVSRMFDTNGLVRRMRCSRLFRPIGIDGVWLNPRGRRGMILDGWCRNVVVCRGDRVAWWD